MPVWLPVRLAFAPMSSYPDKVMHDHASDSHVFSSSPGRLKQEHCNRGQPLPAHIGEGKVHASRQRRHVPAVFPACWRSTQSDACPRGAALTPERKVELVEGTTPNGQLQLQLYFDARQRLQVSVPSASVVHSLLDNDGCNHMHQSRARYHEARNYSDNPQSHATNPRRAGLHGKCDRKNSLSDAFQRDEYRPLKPVCRRL